MVVLSPEALAEHQELMARLKSENPSSSLRDVGSAQYLLARLGMLAWPVTISKGRLTLPQEARDLGIVPAEAEARVALLAFRGIFEIWRPEELRAEVQKSAGQWAELRARGLIGL
jgi:hypothetical protein